MDKCIKAIEVIPTNQRAVVVFTLGDHLNYDGQGNGVTGNWKIRPDKLDNIDKVIIYLRKPNDFGGRIYLATIVGFEESKQVGRYIIKFTNLEEVCATKSNWSEFANTGSNPVYYLN